MQVSASSGKLMKEKLLLDLRKKTFLLALIQFISDRDNVSESYILFCLCENRFNFFNRFLLL